MKTCFPSTICILLHLGLLNFALQVLSSCSVEGPSVYEAGDQLILKCVDNAGHQKNWTLKNSISTELPQENDHRTNIKTNGSLSILTKKNVTLNDSGVYRCQCNGNYHDHDVLVFKASMYASLDNASCELAIILVATVQHKDKEHFSFNSFHCPTLGSSKIWEFSSVTNHRGDHVIHRLAVGKSGDYANQTCYFTIVHPGAKFTKNFSKTVEVGLTSCSEQRYLQLIGTNDSVPCNQGSGTKRPTQFNLLLTALILLATH